MEDYGYKYYSDFLSGDPCGFEQIVKCEANVEEAAITRRKPSEPLS